MLGEKAHFHGLFRRASLFYEKHVIQTEDTKRKARHLQRICEQLGDNARRKRILDDAIERFHSKRPKFLELLDTSNMLAFSNGVYDFTTFQFREGRPDDFISVQLSIPYQPADQLSEDCAFVMDFMTSIQPDRDTREYLLKVLSLCLTTDSSQQLFFIFTGAGANGKSKLMNFLMDTLGEHFGAAPAALLTRRREDANQANEALSGLEKCRVAVFSEGASSEILQVNTIKLFSGEDAISTRGLHEKQRRWKPRFICILVCNDIPRLDENSWAGWRRMRVISFPTLFVDNPIRPNEREKDPEIGEKLMERATAFISILITFNRRFKTEGLSEPALVSAATQKYQTANDIVAEFCEDYVEEGERGTILALKEMYPVFKRWADRNNRTIPTKINSTPLFNTYFKEAADTNHCSRAGKGTYGWRNRRLVRDAP
jgi:P4 family phage/plasmid primase-like protien